VVSLSPSFPASGAPTCRVRALDAFQRGLQKIHVEDNYSGTAKAIIEQLCRENDVAVQFSTVEEEGSEEEDVIVAKKLSVMFEAQPAQPRTYVHAVILGSEERHPLMNEDILCSSTYQRERRDWCGDRCRVFKQ
jgi:hypothetical protein